MGSKIQGSKTKLTVYRSLKTEIITGQKQPGQRLDADEIKNEFGTSIALVREALQMLSHERLVTIKPRSGYFVSFMSLKELRDLLELREVLEKAAIELATTNITEEAIAELETIHGEYTGDDSESYSRYTDENRNFHYLIAKASGNDELAEALGHVLDRLARFMVIRRAGKSLPDIHGRLIKTLKQRDSEAANQAITSELKETKNAIMDKIMREEGENLILGAK